MSLKWFFLYNILDKYLIIMFVIKYVSVNFFYLLLGVFFGGYNDVVYRV